MRSNKPRSQPQPPEENIQSFIAGAERQESSAYPWQSPNVRPDVTKVFNLRLPEDVYLKLKYLSDKQRRRSMQTICQDAIEPYIEQELKKLLDSGLWYHSSMVLF